MIKGKKITQHSTIFRGLIHLKYIIIIQMKWFNVICLIFFSLKKLSTRYLFTFKLIFMEIRIKHDVYPNPFEIIFDS